jgi:hypothetical protein
MSITSFAIVASQVVVGRAEVVGNLSGIAPGGAYKIPLRLVYPSGSSNGVAISEPWNSTQIDGFGIKGGTLASIAYFLQQIPYLVGGTASSVGYTYVTHEWSKFVVDQELATSFAPPQAAVAFGALPIAFDATWVIAAGQDAYTIMADVSTFVRDPLAFNPFSLLPAPPSNDKVIGYGYSQTGMLLRGFATQLLNSSLGVGFPNGLVYEGTMACACGSTIRVQTNVGPGFVTWTRAPGATPSSEGAFINLSTETELFILEAHGARVNPSPSHYAWYEIAAIAHISGDIAALQLTIERNAALQRSVHRGMTAAMLAKIDSAVGFPTSVGLDGTPATRSAPIFAGASASSYITGIPFNSGVTVNTFVGVVSDEDGNFLGGIRLPHVRTRLANGQCVGSPLGTLRGIFSPGLTIPAQTAANAVQVMPQIAGGYAPFLQSIIKTGMTSPWEPSLLATRYRAACEYASTAILALA